MLSRAGYEMIGHRSPDPCTEASGLMRKDCCSGRGCTHLGIAVGIAYVIAYRIVMGISLRDGLQDTLRGRLQNSLEDSLGVASRTAYRMDWGIA